MKDRRLVGDLSIEELEQILRLRKRQERLERLRQMGRHAETLDPLATNADDLPVAQLAGVQARRGIRWDWLRDRSLLVIELGVAAALAFVLVSALTTVREVNQAASQAQELPALTPTALIRVVLLPSGHTPPDAPGGPAPEAVPAHLRSLVEQVTPLPLPTRGPEQAQRIQIPAIAVDAPVVEGDDWEALKEGAGHHTGSANPGERGNCVISAHNDIFGEIFRDLPTVELGDEVFVHTASQSYRYVVTQKRFIAPTDVSVLGPTSGPVLTLLTCYPYGIDTQRVVVIAELQP